MNRLTLLATVLALAAVGIYADDTSEKVVLQCRDLAKAYYLVGPDEVLVKGKVCKIVKDAASAATVPAPERAPTPQPQSPTQAAPAPAQEQAATAQSQPPMETPSAPAQEQTATAQPKPPINAQGKPRVFVKGQGTTNTMTKANGYGKQGWFGGRTDSIVDAHDESIELSKDLREECPGVVVTLKEDSADFVVMLNRESKAKKGLLSKNSQVLVANRQGDVIWTKDVRQVTSAAKDACAAIQGALQAAP